MTSKLINPMSTELNEWPAKTTIFFLSNLVYTHYTLNIITTHNFPLVGIKSFFYIKLQYLVLYNI